MSSYHDRDASPQPQVLGAPGAFPPSPKSDPDSCRVSAPQSLSLAVRARRSEYIRKKTIKVKVGTWNVAALSGTDKDVGAWFVKGQGVRGLTKNVSGMSTEDQAGMGKENEEIIESVEDQEARRTKKEATVPQGDTPALAAGEDVELYVLGLQEIVDINSASEALRPFPDPNPARKWKAAVEEALPRGYHNVAEQQMSGLLLLVYASPEVAAALGPASTTSVGTGLMGYMRNKGAVCARLVLGETSRFVFINCHLAAGSDKAAIDRRNWDVGQILSRIRFEPMTDRAEVVEEFGDGIGDEDFTFWFGDLNYRLDDVPGEDVRRLLLLHTRNEYDLNNLSKRKIDNELGHTSMDQDSSSTDADKTSQCSKHSKGSSSDQSDGLPLDPESDPASLQTTLQSLLSHDQLRDQQKKHKAFHDGWREGEIKFLPTYKYNVGSVGMFDSGDKKRGPSWCDRILFRTRQDHMDAERRMKEEDMAREKDAEMKEQGLDISDEDVIFESDPGTPGFPGTPGYAPGDYYDETEDAAGESELERGGSGTDDAISLEYYGSHQRVLSSDHKPLDAVFTITYEAVIPELKAQVHQTMAREFDKQENDGRPGVTVIVDNQPKIPGHEADDPAQQAETNGVDFGAVRFGVQKSAGLTVANTSGVAATFLFVDRPIEDGQKNCIAPPWLHLEVHGDSDNANSNRNALQEYTLSPGETIYVQLDVEVLDLKLVRKLNEGKVKLDDVLVLRIKDGRDHFIPLVGSWMLSSFCRTLDELVWVPQGGVRQLQLDTANKAAGSESPSREREPIGRQKLSAPRELFALTEAVQTLSHRVIAEWDMTQQEGSSQPPWRQEPCGVGWPFEPHSWDLKPSSDRTQLLVSVREALDTGASLTSYFPEEASALHRLEVLAQTLVTFLQSLQDGIITSELWAQIDSQMSTTIKSEPSDTDPQWWILETLSSTPIHNVAFTFITFTLARVADEIAPLPSKTTNTEPPQSPRLSSSSAHSDSATTDPQTQQQQTSLTPITTTSPISPTATSSRPQTSILSSFRRSRVRTSASASTEDPPASEAVARRHAVEAAYADIFAEAMIRKPAGVKDRKATKEKMRKLLLPFLSLPD
jgi:inositol polyphosphate 5-phosphatase INPP5B/F